MRVLLVLSWAILGCSGADRASSDSTGPCAARSGGYKLHYVEHAGGTCGSIPDQIVSTSPDGTESTCTGSFAPSDQNCTTSGQVTCPAGSDGSRLTEAGTCHWSGDARSGTCEVQATLRTASGDTTCTSVYTIAYAKL